MMDDGYTVEQELEISDNDDDDRNAALREL